MAVAAMSVTLILINYRQQIQLFESQELARLEGLASTLALHINGDHLQALHQQYKEKDAIHFNEQDDRYLKLHDVLHNAKDANGLKTEIYTMVYDSVFSCFYFGVSSADKPFWNHHYNDFPVSLRENYGTGGTIGQYSDKNGVWLSAFQPILNSNGNVVGVLQVDEQFDEFIMEARSSILENTLYSLLFVVPISALLYFFLQTFRKLRERLDCEKEEIDRLRTELFANISHDLRTPLASIQGYLETILMKKDSIDPERRDRYLSISLSNTERLRKLVDELFELSKLQSKEYKLTKEPFLLSELAKDVVNEYRLEASRKGISLREDIPQDLPMISADLGMIDRVLNNLLSNALKFTPSGGTISLRVWQSGSELCISLEDTGVGISAEDLPKIWDRFHTKPAGETEGTGLGLAIVKRIFELHNAPHRVDSVLGQGTRFVFCLPVH